MVHFDLKNNHQHGVWIPASPGLYAGYAAGGWGRALIYSVCIIRIIRFNSLLADLFLWNMKIHD